MTMNSNEPQIQKPNVSPVVENKPTVRKKSLGRKFLQLFVNGNPRDIWPSLVDSVIVPGIKDIIANAGRSGVDMLFYGSDIPTSTSSTPFSSGSISYGNNNYNAMYKGQPKTVKKTNVVTTANGTRRFRFDDIVFRNIVDARKVLEGLRATLNQYKLVTVSTLYELCDLESVQWTDNEVGWYDLSDVRIIPVIGGYILDLPTPGPLN